MGQLLNYFYYGASLFQLIKSANRFFATLYVVKYRIIFSIENSKRIIKVAALITLLPIIPFCFYDCNFIFHSEIYAWRVRNLTCEFMFTGIDLSFTAATLLISFIFDIITFLRLRFYKLASSNLPRDIRFFAQVSFFFNIESKIQEQLLLLKIRK